MKNTIKTTAQKKYSPHPPRATGALPFAYPLSREALRDVVSQMVD